MSHRAISRSFLCAVLLAGLGFCLIGCGGGGGGGGPDDVVLFVKKFLVVDKSYKSLGATGSTDVYRDSRLLFEFSGEVDPNSVSERSIRIGVPTGGGLFLAAVGRFEAVPDRPNWVVFNPTFSKDNPGTVPDNPLGFEPNSPYNVEILTFPDTEVYLRNLDGDALAQEYRGNFTTTDSYLPSPNQPEVTNYDPADGATGIDSRADIRIFFTEPMKPDTIIFGQTFIVTDTFSGRQPLGELRYSPDYRTVTFRPLFGYGKGTNHPDPNVAGVPIQVLVTRDITNLAGRQIPVALRFDFRTAYDPTQPDFFDVRETFGTTNFEDRTYGQGNVGGVTYGDLYPLAAWNSQTAPDKLRGVFTSGQSTINNNNAFVTLEPFAVGNIAAQWQALYYSSEVGGSARTITGFEWHKYARSFTTQCAGTQILMGQTSSAALSTNFSSNYNGSPTVCAGPGNYSITTGTYVFYPGPTFSTNFAYNGNDNLILEIQHTGSNGGGFIGGVAIRGYAEWLENNTGTQTRAAQTAALGAAYAPSRTATFAYDTRFFYLIDQSEAQSLWYDSTLTSPQFLDAVVFGTTPVGTSVMIEYRGAPVLPLSGGQPDIGNASLWTANLAQLSGYQFIQWHAELQGNGTSNAQPEIDDLIFPYIDFD